MTPATDKLLAFRNRLEKVARHVGKTARRQGITCYRIYDHDLPEAPFIIEIYEDKLYVAEYKRRHNLSDEAHEAWLNGCIQVMSEVLLVPPDKIYIKARQRKESRLGQYQKLGGEKNEAIVKEGGLQFIVNLSDYLDTGLFLDHRITRAMVADLSAGKRVLNLFCYTASFSIYAIKGGAEKVVSVDLSKTYLAWAERNRELNFLAYTTHQAVHADVLLYLNSLPDAGFDLIVMDPPTFSNSKRMDDFLEVQRDHVGLINNCLRILSPGGILFFSTNYTRFKIDKEEIRGAVNDITAATTPFDFAGKLKRQCYKISKNG